MVDLHSGKQVCEGHVSYAGGYVFVGPLKFVEGEHEVHEAELPRRGCKRQNPYQQ